MKRRSFVSSLGLAAAPLAAETTTATTKQVMLSGDGMSLTPAEQSRLLTELSGDIVSDNYSLGGSVEKLEKFMAEDLGKEYAVFVPTGTLANHMAMRLLCGSRRRAIAQAESHLYNDCGDCVQTLSGINMVPLAPGKATFTVDEVEELAKRGAGSRVDVTIGAIQIESPVRRRTGEQFDYTQMQKISAWARANKVGMHLDGARLYLQSAYTGISPKQYATLFDTVYISVYKCFNAPSGAILAGPKALLENAYHMRRMFGGGIPHSWPNAAIAHHYAKGFPERMRKAVENSEGAISTLSKDSNFEIQRIERGTNIFKLRVRGVNALVYQQRMFHAGLTANEPFNEWFTLQVNETWARASATEIVDRFRKALWANG